MQAQEQAGHSVAFADLTFLQNTFTVQAAFAQRLLERGGQLARQSYHRERIRTIRRDVDVEHRLAQPEMRDDIGADGGRGVQLHDPVFEPLGRQRQLAGGAEHPLGIDTAHLARTDLQAAGQLRADARDRHDLPLGHVRRRGRDRELRRSTDVHGAQREPIGVGMRRGFDDAAGDDVRQPRPVLDVVDREAEAREARDDRIGIGRQFDVVAQPRQRYAH